MASTVEPRFAFGRNWKQFSKTIDEDRITAAIVGLSSLLRDNNLAGRTFLDIGCGSGLSSIAALRLNAKVLAFDFDQDSVEAARANLTRFAPGDAWRVERGSALDADYMTRAGQFDIVHAWGVLHHTGDMWRAIEIAAAAVTPGGRLALALYNDQGGASLRWRAIKKAYVQAPSLLRMLIVLGVGAFFELRSALFRLVRLQNPLPFAKWRRRKADRGMSYWHDLVDWVGGYPFEVAKPEEVFDFLRERGFLLAGLKTRGGHSGCNEFLFVKSRQP